MQEKKVKMCYWECGERGTFFIEETLLSPLCSSYLCCKLIVSICMHTVGNIKWYSHCVEDRIEICQILELLLYALYPNVLIKTATRTKFPLAQQLFQLPSVPCIPSLSHFKPTWNFYFLVTPSCSPCKKRKSDCSSVVASNKLVAKAVFGQSLPPSLFCRLGCLSLSFTVCVTFISQLYPD